MAQIIAGILYITWTRSFLTQSMLTLNAVSSDNLGTKSTGANKRQLKLLRLARWLFASAIGMVLLVATVIPVMAFSGSVIYGIYAPSGWGLTFGGAVFFRCYIQIRIFYIK